LTANFTSNATVTGWERPDESTAVGVSVNGLTESSGIFTFPSTGIYHIFINTQMENGSSADGTMGMQIDTSVDGGSNFTLAAFMACGDSDTGTNNGTSGQTLFNVTDTAQARFRFAASSLSSGSFVHGNSTYNMTSFSCIKILPVQ
jgi:hypothetical protein